MGGAGRGGKAGTLYTTLLSTDVFIVFLQCYISAHKRQAEDKDNKGWTETKLKTTKILFVCL